ncbi:MAG: VOC family protein [Bdellovibrionales bacterium]
MAAPKVLPQKLGIVPWYTYQTAGNSKSLDFYQKLFQWKTQSFSIPGQGQFDMWTADSSQFADIDTRTKLERATWATYVLVENVEETLKKVSKMKGKVLKPAFDLPGIGRMGLFADPFGATLWVYTPTDFSQSDSAMGTTEGRVCWHELMVNKPEEARAFYSELFNWKIDFDAKTKMHFIKAHDKVLGHIMQTPQSAQKETPAWHLYFMTQNLDKTATQAQKLGARCLMAKTEVPQTGFFSFWEDPAGAFFYLWQPTTRA